METSSRHKVYNPTRRIIISTALLLIICGLSATFLTPHTLGQAVYQVRRVIDPQGRPLGYDLDENGTPDVPYDRVSSYIGQDKDARKDLTWC